jgi:hypothetical protein
MKDVEGCRFHHRINADGTIDSICLCCFLTAAKGNIGSDLREIEAAHECHDKERMTENLRRLRRH